MESDIFNVLNGIYKQFIKRMNSYKFRCGINHFGKAQNMTIVYGSMEWGVYLEFVGNDVIVLCHERFELSDPDSIDKIVEKIRETFLDRTELERKQLRDKIKKSTKLLSEMDDFKKILEKAK